MKRKNWFIRWFLNCVTGLVSIWTNKINCPEVLSVTVHALRFFVIQRGYHIVKRFYRSYWFGLYLYSFSELRGIKGNSIQLLGPYLNVGASCTLQMKIFTFISYIMNLNCGCQDCFLTSWSMITWYVLCITNLLGFIAAGIYLISVENAKLQNLIIEPVFSFCALQSIRHCQ